MSIVTKGVLALFGFSFVLVTMDMANGDGGKRPAGAQPAQAETATVKQPLVERKEAPEPRSAEDAAREQKEAEDLASGEHCLSGWDGSFPRLKTAVKKSLRNPKSFDHISTARSPVDKKGTFALIMTYRAENGFGGMNVDAAGVEVDAATCDFKQVSNAALAKRLSR